MKKYLALFFLLALSATARANVICSECEYGDSAGTYLGVLNAATGDVATFFNNGIGDRLFVNFWVFDVGPTGGKGVTAASFVVETFIRLFRGQLFYDDGSQCALGIGCLSVELGALIADDFQVNRHIEIPFELEPGRYVLRISGGTVPPKEGGYDGIIKFFPISMRESGTLALFGLGLIGIAAMMKRRV